ncbi:MAG: DEAD/DEAH box helicase family protein [Thermotogota bacterium]|nr:DEAD/DEAH box helicase family protein [Thermotogota bacterium]
MIKIEVNSSRGRIIDCPDKVAKYLYKECSYQYEGYEFTDPYINGIWDGYVRKFSIKTHSFPSGLLYRIQRYLRRLNQNFEVEDKRKEFEWDEKSVLKAIDNFKFALRPYQIDGLVLGLKHPYMVYWQATGSGKTVQFSALIAALKKDKFRNTLILVANKDLAAQHRVEVGDMIGSEIGLIQEGKFQPKDVTVAVINTLWNKAVRQKNKIVLKYLENVEYLIIDEVHRSIDSKMFRQTINKCKNTIARHGFSGTPFSLTTDDLELEAVTGPPLFKVSVSKLIREGWSSRPHIDMIKYDFPYFSGRYSASVYKRGITENEIRNEIILDLIEYEFFKSNNVSVLVIVKIIKHGKILSDGLSRRGLDGDFKFIHGSSPDIERMETKKALKNKDLRIVIASQIWNEGIDIPSVDVLIKADAGGGKSVRNGKGVRSVIQQTGRVIRKPITWGNIDVNTEEENIVRIYDFFDDCHDDLRRWSVNRFQTFQMEKEFIVRRINYDAWKREKGIV